MPIRFYEEPSVYKLFTLDVGLLGAMSNASPRLMLISNDVFVEFKGAFTENYVLQQLKTIENLDIYYYSKEKSTLEIDFLVQTENHITPVEVKAEENVKSKSLSQFVNVDYADRHFKGLRCSMKQYIDQEWMINIPLCSIYAYFSGSNNLLPNTEL